MTRQIVVLTNRRDLAADPVVALLSERGLTVKRLNIDDGCSAPVAAWNPAEERASPSVVWWRQFESESRPETVADVDDVLVARAQWRSWLSTLDHPQSAWMNPLWAARRAENKIEQLRVAEQLGFLVPPTLVANDRDQIRDFAGDHGPCVVKSLASAYFSFSDQSFVFTEPLDNLDDADATWWHEVPVIAQAQVLRASDLRVIVVGDAMFGARCTVDQLDWRKAPHDPDMWHAWVVPRSLRELCQRYRRTLGLEYVAFDFMSNDDGIWFLEANQAGEFGFLDRAAGLAVGVAIADRLQALSHEDA